METDFQSHQSLTHNLKTLNHYPILIQTKTEPQPQQRGLRDGVMQPDKWE